MEDAADPKKSALALGCVAPLIALPVVLFGGLVIASWASEHAGALVPWWASFSVLGVVSVSLAIARVHLSPWFVARAVALGWALLPAAALMCIGILVVPFELEALCALCASWAFTLSTAVVIAPWIAAARPTRAPARRGWRIAIAVFALATIFAAVWMWATPQDRDEVVLAILGDEGGEERSVTERGPCGTFGPTQYCHAGENDSPVTAWVTCRELSGSDAPLCRICVERGCVVQAVPHDDWADDIWGPLVDHNGPPHFPRSAVVEVRRDPGTGERVTRVDGARWPPRGAVETLRELRVVGSWIALAVLGFVAALVLSRRATPERMAQAIDTARSATIDADGRLHVEPEQGILAAPPGAREGPALVFGAIAGGAAYRDRHVAAQQIWCGDRHSLLEAAALASQRRLFWAITAVMFGAWPTLVAFFVRVFLG